MAQSKKSKKVLKAKTPMAVTKAGPKSHPKPQPKAAKAVVVHTLPADLADMRKYMPASSRDEKALPQAEVKQLESLFLALEKHNGQ